MKHRLFRKIACFLLALLLVLPATGTAETVEDPREEQVVDSGTAHDSNAAERPRSYEDLAVTGAYVWQVTDGFIRCLDAKTKAVAAEQPLSFLYEGLEDYLALASRGESVILLAATGSGDADCRVTLYEMAMRDREITLLDARDATKKLAFLFDGQTQWLEVDFTGCAGGLLVSRLDQESVYRLSVYDPETEETRELGTVNRGGFTAVFARGEDILMIGSPENNPDAEALTQISLTDGARETLGTISLDAMASMTCCALDEAGDTLYYTAGGSGYRYKIGGGAEPEPFCAAKAEAFQLRYGAFAAGQYIMLDEEGGLLWQDAGGVMQVSALRILDLTGAEMVNDAVPGFSAGNPEYLAVVTLGDDAGDVLTAMMNQNADYDAYVISLGSDLYQALFSRGYLGDLSGSTALTEAVDAFPERIRTRIVKDGKLTAFPIGLQNNVMLLDTEAITEMTGLGREEIPTDWPGLLALLEQIGEENLMDGSGRAMAQSGIDAEVFRITILTSVLQDAMLWLNEDENRINGLQAALTPALQALERIDWTRLGLSEDDGREESWETEDEETPTLIDWTTPEIAVMSIRKGLEYWPLSLEKGGERLIPQDVAVIILNPRSAHPEGVIRFMETMNEEMDIITRMELDVRLNEPVENQSFDMDIAYLQSMVPMYEEAIAGAETPEEAAELEEELEDMKSFLENYAEAGAWLVSGESIALYRSLEDRFAVHGDEFWYDETENSIFLQYADGMLDAAQFVRQLVLTLQMSRMETE